LFVKTKEEALFGEAGAATRTAAAADHARLGNRVKKLVVDSENERSELIEFDEDQVSIMEMIRRYHSLPWVEYAEPEYIIFPLETRPCDVYANGSYVYHLDIIKAPLSWYITSDSNPIVAVLVTGFV